MQLFCEDNSTDMLCTKFSAEIWRGNFAEFAGVMHYHHHRRYTCLLKFPNCDILKRLIKKNRIALILSNI